MLQGSGNERRPAADDQSRAIARLIVLLNDPDQAKRRQARLGLMALGQAAMPSILNTLKFGPENSRWQVAKALSQLADPSTAPALVQALRDHSFGVRWLAAEGLTAMSCDGLEPLLAGLICDADSVWLREGAHHVLHSMHDNGLAETECAVAEDVLCALEGPAPASELPWKAEAALEKLRQAHGQPAELPENPCDCAEGDAS